MSDERCYIAPARRKSATEKVTREDGGRDGRAEYRERGDRLDCTVRPKQIRMIIRKEG